MVHLASPTGFGYGDVKFGVLVGLGLGVLRPGLGIVVFVDGALVQLAVAWCRPWPAQRAPGAIVGRRRSGRRWRSLRSVGSLVVLVVGRWCVMRFLRPLLWLAGAAGAMVGFVAVGGLTDVPLRWGDLGGWFDEVSVEDALVELARWVGMALSAT